jgi:glucokinase
MTRLLGVDVGGSSVKAVLLDGPRFDQVADQLVPVSDVIGFETDLTAELVREHRPDGVGVGLAGLVDPDGRFVWGPHLPDGPIDLPGVLSDRLGMPVTVDNDANCALVAEVERGSLRGYRDAALVAVGSGIGAGLLSGGAVVRGAHGFAGEVGHLRVDPDGRPCVCGRTGCWETVVSGTRLDEEAARLLGPGSGGADLVAAARSGDGAASAVLEEMGAALGRGVALLVMMLDIEAVAIGGGMSEAGDDLLRPAQAAIASELSGAGHRPEPVLVGARFGRLSGAVGAALRGGGGTT